ncbi:AAA-ATPase-like domain-containing protein [Neocallimastix lanati (nom. inval.)]|nr:AAA-ATPase-like domain-containing protein [Neocallimastix sp. JGI-2020a]
MENIIFNPGDYDYKNFIKNNEYFVDKTNLIMELNKRINSNMKFFCVTTPRNFGKTVIVNMLVAYYSFFESKINVFDDKKISKNKDWDKHLGKYNVIKLDMEKNFFNNNIKDGIENIKKTIIDDVKMNDKHFECNKEEDIDVIIEKIYRRTQRKIVLIIDDWDLVLRDTSYDENSRTKYLKFLSLLIKDNENIVLTYMTGILPIQNYEQNYYFDIKFTDFSMISPGWMAEYIGINNDEVIELCQIHLTKKMFKLSNKKQRLNNGSINKIDKNRKFGEELLHKNKNEKVDGDKF